MSSTNLSRFEAKRVNPTGQTRTRKYKVFDSKGRPNRKLLKKLDANPMSYNLPREFLYMNDTDTIEPASNWLDSNRNIRSTYEDEYELIGDNYIQTKWNTNQTRYTYSFDQIVATYNTKVINKLGFDSIGRDVLGRFKNIFKKRMRIHRGVKFHFAFETVFNSSQRQELPPFWMSIESDVMTDVRQFPRIIREAVRDIKAKIEKMQKGGSGMTFIKAQHVSAQFLQYNPTRGGTFIPTPDKLKNPKYGLVNVENKKKENECFKDAILACIHYGDLKTKSQKSHRGRATTYKEWENELDVSMFTFPIDPNSRKIETFERKNNIAVNIYQYYKGSVYILKQTKLQPPDPTEPTTRRFANLLLVSNKGDTVHHYIAATNMSGLLCSQNSSTHNGKTFPCQYCLHCFTTQTAFDNHQKYCASHDAIATEMPEPGSKMKFKNTFHQVKGSGCIYSDFESFNHRQAYVGSGEKSFTTKVAHQTPNSYKLVGVCENGKQFHKRYIIEGGQSRRAFMAQFFKDLTLVGGLMRKQFQIKRDIKKMIMSETQKAAHDQKTKCYLCKEDFCFKKSDVKLSDEGVTKLRGDMKKAKKTELQIKVAVAKLKEQRWKEKGGVRDHNHCTGEYIGAACWKCNINRHERWYKIPVIFHNLQGYDGKIIVRECVEMAKRVEEQKKEQLQPRLAKREEEYEHVLEEEDHLDNVGDNDPNYLAHLRDKKLGLVKEITNLSKQMKRPTTVDVIPINTEKYLSFQCGGLRFIDSMSFMNSSPDTLASNLDDSDKKITKKYFKKYKDITLLLQKGVYPYSWVDSVSKFQLDHPPPIEAFYNDLSESACSTKDYEHAQAVWKKFRCKTFLDYHNLYLDGDVCLLADVFETFRNLMMKTHGLDPCHYYSCPQLGFDADLKMTDISLDLFSDRDMHLMVESGIRGGISFISHRKAVANNKYMGKLYDPSKPSKYIMYVDANNLYGKAMMQPLGYKDFVMDDPTAYKVSKSRTKNLAMIDRLTACDNPDEDHNGYIMECDLDYPDDLHDLHNAYPFLAELIAILEKSYSPYQESCMEMSESKTSKVKKLIPTLRDKKSYILDIRLLRCAMKHGLKLKKIHRVMKFTQKAWMKPYINHNTNLRADAKNDFEKDFYKLMNNAPFGKCMENVRNRTDFEIITDKERLAKATRNPRCKMPIHQFDEDCVGVEYKKKKVKLCKPIYCGLQILDVSKITMYDFHYDRMMKAYGHERVKLLFTDTDSFAYEVETDDFYEDMRTLDAFKVGGDNNIFDTSNYPKDHPLYSLRNLKQPGYFKDEAGGKIITSFIGLRAKMYSYETMTPNKKGEVHQCTHKGVAKKVKIPHSDYEECLASQRCTYAEWSTIRGKKHELHVIKLRKKALSAMDDKTYLLADGINSLKWGHKDIPPEKNIPGSSNNAVC